MTVEEFLEISIHAPIQGAIWDKRIFIKRNSNFNPRTYTRCDRIYAFGHNVGSDFNPRTYTRCDYNILIEYYRLLEISIHAPIQGAIFFHL